MLRNATAVLFACSAMTIVGCSSSDDDDTSAGGGTEAGIFRVSVTNLTTGQPMTPPVVALHDASVSLFTIGQAASPELQAIAEDGNNDPMVALAASLSEVSASGVAPGPFGPGETTSIVLETEAADQVLSVVNMVVCTNDGFSGTDSMALPTGSDTLSFEAVAYDAGTELNELDPDYWVAPCGGSGDNLHEDEGGITTPHLGQTGTGDFDFVGTESVIRIDVERLESTEGTYEIAFTNLSVGQPMTPPVAAIHDPSVSLFTIGDAASPQLQAIAEDGNNAPMVALAQSLDEVSAAGVAFVDPANPGPIQPSQTANLTLVTDGVAQVFSAVNMVVCTNDGFTGFDSIELPTGSDTLTLTAVPYDAGTETNVLDPDYWVQPCGGNGTNMHEDENGVTGPHPGQTGTGNFDFVGTDAILEVTIARVVETGGEVDGGEVDGGETGGEVDGGEVDGGETGGETTGGTPGGSFGPVVTALQATGHGNFVDFLDTSIGSPSLEDNTWTVFAPTDAALAAATGTVSEQDHIFVGGNLDPDALAALAEIVTNGSNAFAIGGDASSLTVGGFAATLIDTGDAGATVYSIDGVLQ